MDLDMKLIVYDDIKEGYYINKNGEIYSTFSNRFLTGNIDEYGYVRVTLQRKTSPKQKSYKIHRLVKIIFDPVENFENLTVDHLDGNKQNNTITNLDWCDSSENVKRAIENKLIHKSGRKLTVEEVINICEWLQKGYSPKMIAQKFYPDDIIKKSRIISEILQGRHWKDISCKYNFWIKYPEFNSKLWTIWDIEEFCQLIEDNPDKTNRQLSNIIVSKYEISEKTAYNLIYDIRKKRKYTVVSQYYNF